MSKYLLVIHDNLEDYGKYSREQLGEVIDKMMHWSQQLKKAGIHKGAEKLSDDPGKLVGRDSITDGPYAESKELIGGFFIVEAESYSRAIQIARECPALGFGSRIEVREIADTCSGVVARGQA